MDVMSGQMTAAQLQQQHNRDCGGRYTTRTHSEDDMFDVPDVDDADESAPEVYTTRQDAIERELLPVLGDYGDEFDVDGIADEIFEWYNHETEDRHGRPVINLNRSGIRVKEEYREGDDGLATDAFWKVVEAHDISAGAESDLPAKPKSLLDIVATAEVMFHQIDDIDERDDAEHYWDMREGLADVMDDAVVYADHHGLQLSARDDWQDFHDSLTEAVDDEDDERVGDLRVSKGDLLEGALLELRSHHDQG